MSSLTKAEQIERLRTKTARCLSELHRVRIRFNNSLHLLKQLRSEINDRKLQEKITDWLDLLEENYDERQDFKYENKRFANNR
jgi:hypothetical protein